MLNIHFRSPAALASNHSAGTCSNEVLRQRRAVGGESETRWMHSIWADNLCFPSPHNNVSGLSGADTVSTQVPTGAGGLARYAGAPRRERTVRVTRLKCDHPKQVACTSAESLFTPTGQRMTLAQVQQFKSHGSRYVCCELRSWRGKPR